MARITGLATGLDMDELVKGSMKPHRIKIQKVQQQKEVLEIKQKLYRDVIEDSRKFYDKYLDPTSKDSLLMMKNYTNVSFESNNSYVATASATASSMKDNYEVNVKSLAKPAQKNLSVSDLQGDGIEDIQFDYNGKKITINIKDVKDDKELAQKLNKELNSIGLKASYSDFAGKVVIESKETGAKIGENDNLFKVSLGKTIANTEQGKEPTFNSVTEIESSKGTNLIATIKSSKGVVNYDGGSGSPGKNTIVLDGVQFNMLSEGETKIVGKNNITEVKDKIVNFVNDYNSLIEKLNKLTLDKKAKGYEPLTEEQKKEMSEDEIKLWNEKVKQGQLGKDSDLTRMKNSMKSAMSSLVSGTGLTLEAIGIESVPDYSGVKNGTFKINEEKLNEALENNLEEVVKLFTQSSEKTGDDKFSEQGLMQRLKTTLYDEVVTVSSPLIQKAGIEGSSTFKNNSLTRMMEEYSKKIEDMEKDFARREQSLYSKWAVVEKAMNSYNSQQSYLMSQLG